MKLFIMCFLIFLSSFHGLVSQSMQKMIDSDSEIYRNMRILALETAFRLPFAAAPVSMDEARAYLDSISLSQLSHAGRILHARSLELLTDTAVFEKENFRLSLNPEVTLELYRTDNDDGQWFYGYERRQPLISIPFELSVDNSFYGIMELSVKEEYRAFMEDVPNYSNIPKSMLHLDWYFPFKAYAAFGGEFWNIQFGRHKINWGNGLSGNLAISDIADFHDYLKATLYWNWFSYTSVYAILDPWLRKNEHTPSGMGYEDFEELYKAFAGHRFDIAIGSKVNLGIVETAIFGNKYPELKDLNPFMVIHNYFIPERSNSLLAIELDITPIRYLSVSLQYAIDEFETPYEENGTRPGATGFLANIQAAVPLGSGHLYGFAEYVQTDPWLYNRWHPNTRFTNRRRIWSYIPPDGYLWIDKPLGHFIGPDSQLVYAGLSYKTATYALGAEFQLWRYSDITTDTEYSQSFSKEIEDIRSKEAINYNLELCSSVQLRQDIELKTNVIFGWYTNYLLEEGNDLFSWELILGITWTP